MLGMNDCSRRLIKTGIQSDSFRFEIYFLFSNDYRNESNSTLSPEKKIADDDNNSPPYLEINLTLQDNFIFFRILVNQINETDPNREDKEKKNSISSKA